MSAFSSSIKEFINVTGLSAKIKALETELTLLKTLQSSLGVKTRGRKPGRPAGSSKAKPAKTKKSKRGRRGAIGKAIRAFLASKGKGGAHVKEIASATKNKPANVTAFFYAPANKKSFKKVAPATFAVVG
jgi:hypothetical protein